MPSSRSTSVLSYPSRPGVFFHLFDSPNSISSSQAVYAISFLSNPLPLPESETVLGWVPVGSEPSFQGFRENPAFRVLLHKAIQEGLKEDVDDIQRNGALQMQSGWMHIHDDRNIPPLGRIGDPDDILASVLIENGKVRASTTLVR
ncbi:hypothetical protein ONZ45_g1822 [Pleurotus djamor]|nr:hypothetical protein ONZ45_g1822 [Pleurotus djamor]